MFGMNESPTANDHADARFIADVARALGRKLTDEEEGLAFDVRSQGGYSAEEAAAEIAAQTA
jgi:hypothetical protein